MQTVLFIGLVWPEPQSSAAGTRIVQLISLFSEAGFRVLFASAASKTPYSYPLSAQGVEEVPIKLNDSSFDDVVQAMQPDAVVFDRFMIEEQYGWRIRQHAPQALTILDTEDLHLLRAARQEAHKKNATINLYNETAKREVAAIWRTDLSLIISRQEMAILRERFKIPESILYYLPFLEEEVTAEHVASWPSFEERANFMFIGNFLHEPNWHTVQVLKKQLWPLLRKRLPTAELHIYGAYASEKVYQLHQPKERFFIKDRAADARSTMARYRALLAPIAFGAGAKGKFIDAMQSGTPSVSSSVGAESMGEEGLWNGFVEDDVAGFVDKAVLLYESETIWRQAQGKGIALLHEGYSKARFAHAFMDVVAQLMGAVAAHRQQHFLNEILHSQQLSSTKYMSLWIEAKNKGNP